MPGCVLRVSGSAEKVKRFLAESSFVPSKVYFRGDPADIPHTMTTALVIFSGRLWNLRAKEEEF